MRTYSTGPSPMLVLLSDPVRRTDLTTLLRELGNEVASATCIADIERWPEGQVVVTERRFFTPFWFEVGATHVVVLDRRIGPIRHDGVVCVPDDWSTSRIAAYVAEIASIAPAP